MSKKLVLPLVILIIAITVFILLKLTRPEAAVSAQTEKKWLVDATTVAITDTAPEITLYGRVETPRNATLKAALEADVSAVHVLEGQTITQGQLLIELDDTDARLLTRQHQSDADEIAALIESERQRFERDKSIIINQKQLVALTDKAVERAKKLGLSKLASQATLDEAMSAHQQQVLALKQIQHDINEHPARLAQLQAREQHVQSLLRQSEVDLQRTRIHAPFAGRIANLYVAAGDRVRAGDSLIHVYDTAQLEVRAQIPGRHIAEINQLLQQNQPLTAKANFAGHNIELVLDRLSGQVRQDSGGIDGLFRIRHGGHTLPLGTFVEFRLQLAAQQGVIEIPFNALYGLDRVYLIENGTLRSVRVKRVGEARHKNGDYTLLIRSTELQAGDKIITTQLPNAITGLAVEIAP